MSWRDRRGAVVTLVTVALLFTTGTSSVSAQATGEPAVAANTWIVTLNEGSPSRDHAQRLARAAKGELGLLFEHALNGFVFHGTEAEAALLARNSRVRSVVPDTIVRITAESVPSGVARTRAAHTSQPNAHDAGFDGEGVRIAILDTGIDLTHPDLAANLDLDLGINCLGGGAPQDGHGHGTHVAGIAAAVGGNDTGVVGVAPRARLVPVKVLDDSGNGTTSQVICGIDHVTALVTDSDPTNDIQVANMSLGETASAGNCSDGGLREAVCRSAAAGVVYIAAAGNSAVNASTFVPASYPEVITVSAINDFDGEPGGLAGCLFFFFYCDDVLAEYSNYGATIEVAAPGTEILSTWTGGGYQTSTGTSMAAPHVAGAAALLLAEDPTLSRAEVAEILQVTGECPDASPALEGSADDCAGQGQWGNDPDGVAEPLINALEAAEGADLDPRPTIEIISPTNGASVSGSVEIVVDASDNEAVVRVDFLVNGVPLSSDSSSVDGWSAEWDTDSLTDGFYSITATATDTVGQTRSDSIEVHVGIIVQGDWVGAYGSDGYALFAWEGNNDLTVLPDATLTLEQGGRATWTTNTTDLRALEAPDQTQRRAVTLWGNNQIRLRLDFTTAYTGDLHLYALDWDSNSRRQTITINDGTTNTIIDLTTSFQDGVWIHTPINVANGGTVTITINLNGGANAVLSGLFLGNEGPPAQPPEPEPQPEPPGPDVQGDWVGAYGSDGYALFAWEGNNDLTVLPDATLTLEQGGRATWTTNTTDLRALEAPDQTQRRAVTLWGNNQIRLRLDFTTAYTGDLHLYALDWDSNSRRQTITINDGTTNTIIDLTTSFQDGVWIHTPINVANGGTVTITINLNGGANAVLSGLFLGNEGPPAQPPEPEPQPEPPGPDVQGDWVGAYGSDGYALFAWEGNNDLTVLPDATLTLEQGGRATWTTNTTDLRALEAPDQTQRRAVTLWGNNQIRLRLDFTTAYTGDLHLYALDWDSNSRRQTITINDGTTNTIIDLTTSFQDGVWIHTPINVANGGTVTITINLNGGANAVLSGLFLGNEGPPAQPPEPEPQPEPPGPDVQGDWVGAYGSDGYALFAWEGNNDLTVLPDATLTLEQGGRATWTTNTTDLRALEAPDQTQRRAVTLWGNNQIRLRLDFTTAYTGDLHLYALDWDSNSRRQTITINDGTTNTIIDLTTSFQDGVWIHTPINVANGGTVTITINLNGGANAVLSGLFLGN